jgi:hypothetical protein
MTPRAWLAPLLLAAASGGEEGADFMRALWSVWLGPKPGDGALTKALPGLP